MKYLKKNFCSQIGLIEEAMEMDVDFRKLCTDYESVAATIDYLAALMAMPRAGLQAQIDKESLLLRELTLEIQLFLAAEENPD